MINEIDLDFLKKNLEEFPELKEAFCNPMEIDPSRQKIVEINKSMTDPLLICDNPDIELPKVPIQLNFIVPQAMRKSKEIYVINIKNDINMYKKLYEKNSTVVNKIIDETKQCLKNLYNPLKSLREDVKNYSNNFENSINQLTIPLQNGKKGLNGIDYKKYEKKKQTEFLKEKDEVIKEINKFLKEANDFYKDYGELNKATSDDINNFVERFNKLAMPAKELTVFMRCLMKAFENSSSSFNDFKDKKKIDEALQKIKEPINEFYGKSKNLENLLDSIKSIKVERINEMMEISKKIKEKINKLEASSKKISEKIKKIRDKYGEPEEKLEVVDIGAPAPVNSKNASNQMEKEGKNLGEKTDINLKDIKEDIDKIKNQTRLDLLFIMDITNSMDTYLNQVKQDILEMISTIQTECAGIDIFLGFIGYRDFMDLDLGGEYINLEFTTDYESIRKNIEFVEADGGGDTPEDLCGGLERGKNKDWRGKTRFAILVTDSPCHGTKYHDLTGEEQDNFPKGDREGRNIEDYIKFFAQNEISLFCLRINSTTDKMFNIFSKIYNDSKNKNSKNEFVLEEGKKLIDIVTKNAINMFQHRDKLDNF
jgi:hypothetical protein